MKTEETMALAVLLAFLAFAVLGVTALNLWSWVSSGLLAAAAFFFVRALLTDSRPITPPVRFDLGPGRSQQPKQTCDVKPTIKDLH